MKNYNACQEYLTTEKMKREHEDEEDEAFGMENDNKESKKILTKKSVQQQEKREIFLWSLGALKFTL